MTFNPNTLNATLTSVPRDIYLKTACSGGTYRRINTTTWGSASTCAVQTIENMFNIDIDYYAKINFKGVVQLVDALGGIEVDVPYSFCEQNSSRQWGSSTVFVEKGLQTLNGEQTLALSRNRHKPNDNSLSGSQMATYCPTYNEGNRSDYTRGKNQIKIIQGIIQKAAKLKDPNQAIEILEKIEKNFQTNITTNNILSLYDLGKSLIISNNTNLINIKRLQLTGRGVWGLVYEESSKSYPAVTIPYQESINAIKKEININLGKLTQIPIKNISFDLNNPYELEIIGQGNYSNINITTLKDLSKYSVNQIKQYAQSINKELKFIDYDTNQEVFINDYNEYNFHIQKEHKDIILDQINSITIYVKKTKITSTPSE
jgi:LCP family protein required for cell wall assembly